MAKPYSDEQIQDNMDAIASPVRRIVASDGRAMEVKSDAELIKDRNLMINTNRAAAGTRRRQIRLMSSKGF